MTRVMPSGWRRIFHKPHWQSYRSENSFRGIDKAARKGYRQIDLDSNITRDGHVVICHWPKFAKDKFRDPRKRYARDATISQLTLAQVLKLRSPDGYRIRPIEPMMARCKARGLVMCLEVKGDPRFANPATWTEVRAAADRTGCVVRVMTLQNLGHNPAGRLAAAKRAGFPTILLVRGRRPANWSTVWEPHVDFLRGKFRR